MAAVYFYTSYAVFFHLGLNDGIYLKQGGKEYSSLDYELLHSNLLFSTLAQTAAGCIAAGAAAWLWDLNAQRQFVILCTAVYIVLCNYAGFLSYVLQLSDRIKEYAVSVVIDKAGFLIIVLIGIGTRCTNFRFYILFFLAAKAVSAVFAVYQCKEVAAAGNVKWDRAFRDIIDNIRVGLTLMVSNVAGMLILGIGRTLIDCHWGVEAFGKFSLALSLSDFFLQFISQVSLVLFPAFRKMDGRKIARTYKTLRTLLSLILSGMLLGYMPLYYLLTLWLPQYSDSLTYMALLLPICVFDGKMNLLCNTYLKVMRREKKLLQINIFALCFSILSCSFSAFVINNIYAVIISMVVSIALRSILGERYLSGCFKMQVGPSLAAESILSFSFVITTWLLGPVEGFVFYAFVYLLYCITKYNDVKKMLSFLTRGGVKA